MIAANGHGNQRKLRAAFAVLALLPGWLAAPVAFATRSQVDCSMACCLEDGYCCCIPNAEEQPSGSEENLSNYDLSKQCPKGCTTSEVSFKLQTRAFAGSAIHQFTSIAAIIATRQFLSSQHRGIFESSSPRAPPFSLHSA